MKHLPQTLHGSSEVVLSVVALQSSEQVHKALERAHIIIEILSLRLITF